MRQSELGTVGSRQGRRSCWRLEPRRGQSHAPLHVPRTWAEKGHEFQKSPSEAWQLESWSRPAEPRAGPSRRRFTPQRSARNRNHTRPTQAGGRGSLPRLLRPSGPLQTKGLRAVALGVTQRKFVSGTIFLLLLLIFNTQKTPTVPGVQN